jgi:hypothetical protein
MDINFISWVLFKSMGYRFFLIIEVTFCFLPSTDFIKNLLNIIKRVFNSYFTFKKIMEISNNFIASESVLLLDQIFEFFWLFYFFS